MFTREELFEYFVGQYSDEQIINALEELSKHDNEIDANADQFPATITERLEQVFKIVEEAINQQKVLTENTTNNASPSLVQVEKLAIEIATERAANIPADVFRGMVEIIAGEAIAKATVLHQISDAVLKHTLAQLNTKSLSDINQESAKQISQITQLLTDPEKLERILDDYGINSSSQVQTELEEITTMKTEFDAGEFLNEVAQAKKPNTPKTILDTRQLTQTLISRYLHS
ncbi:hypothetical protein [Calothrix sp. 336/3]|uniref:hypothetical protein n=1 Tax=Calothrix sp. 336/3 TaxID=1337936 RepID=UPI0004E3198A|nr:hypothetical protein [Calothrix sp. 336/3]AKG21302.1 hypothetical protein IJ00_08295 [Calothrix sp. 336/3]